MTSVSVYRRKYKGRDGKPCASKFYTIELRDDAGGVERIASKLTDKRAAQKKGQDLRVARELGEVGLADRFKEGKKTAFASAVDEFCGHLLGSLNRDDEYAYIARVRLMKFAAFAGWLSLGDVTLPTFERGRSDLGRTKDKRTKRPPKPQTVNQYIDTLTEFLDWCVAPARKIPANPLAGVSKATVAHDPNYRRAASGEELERLLRAADKSGRKTVYLFLLYHPLRRDTIENLRWHHLHLSDKTPWGETPPESTKSRRAERFRVRGNVAALLLAERNGARDNDLVFPRVPTVADLKADLSAAGVRFDDGKGKRRLDLHAFRKTLAQLCVSAGMDITEASKILHHKDVATTRKHYRDLGAEVPLDDAVERLPEIGGGA